MAGGDAAWDDLAVEPRAELPELGGQVLKPHEFGVPRRRAIPDILAGRVVEIQTAVPHLEGGRVLEVDRPTHAADRIAWRGAARSQPLFQLLLGTARLFRVWMGFRVRSDEIVRPQRFDGGQEPSLVFAVRQNHFARQAASRCRGPSSHLGAEFSGTVPIAIERDEDCLAGRLTARDRYGLHHAMFACQLIAGSANGRSNLHRPSTGLIAQAPQQNRQCLLFAVAFDDWLDQLHSISVPSWLGRVCGPKGIRPQQLSRAHDTFGEDGSRCVGNPRHLRLPILPL